MAGYSGRPLAAKLGIKEGFAVLVRNPPESYEELLEGLPEGVEIAQEPPAPPGPPSEVERGVEMVHLFTRSRKELAEALPELLPRIRQDGMIWVSWPKKASGVPSDVEGNVIRELAFPLGLVDVKVCAVDDTWSGLKLVIRKENRR